MFTIGWWVTHKPDWGLMCQIKLRGVNVAAEVNPTVRRQGLRFLLRRLRAVHGLNVEDVAEHVMWSPTKISRIERNEVAQNLAMCRISWTSTK